MEVIGPAFSSIGTMIDQDHVTIRLVGSALQEVLSDFDCDTWEGIANLTATDLSAMDEQLCHDVLGTALRHYDVRMHCLVSDLRVDTKGTALRDYEG